MIEYLGKLYFNVHANILQVI